MPKCSIPKLCLRSSNFTRNVFRITFFTFFVRALRIFCTLCIACERLKEALSTSSYTTTIHASVGIKKWHRTSFDENALLRSITVGAHILLNVRLVPQLCEAEYARACLTGRVCKKCVCRCVLYGFWLPSDPRNAFDLVKSRRLAYAPTTTQIPPH